MAQKFALQKIILFFFKGCIHPLCELLTVMDAKIIQVALSGLENILRLGQQEAQTRSGPNAYAILIEECYGNGLIYIYILCGTYIYYYERIMISRICHLKRKNTN